MGIQRAEAAGTPSGEQLKKILGESEDQLLGFSGAKEAITGMVSTLDLAAAAIFRFHYGQPYENDPDHEHDLASFPSDSNLPTPLPPEVRHWLNSVKNANEMRRLKILRERFSHRYFPRHLAIGAGFDHQVDLDGKRERLGDLLVEFKAFVIDRLVELGDIYLLERGDRST